MELNKSVVMAWIMCNKHLLYTPNQAQGHS